MGEHSFPKNNRLTRTRDYQDIYRSGRRIASRHFALFYRPAAAGCSRIGLASGKKVGGAVVRNLVKRRLREILRNNKPGFKYPVDVILVAYPKAATLTYGAMAEEIRTVLAAARLIDKESERS